MHGEKKIRNEKQHRHKIITKQFFFVCCCCCFNGQIGGAFLCIKLEMYIVFTRI